MTKNISLGRIYKQKIILGNQKVGWNVSEFTKYSYLKKVFQILWTLYFSKWAEKKINIWTVLYYAMIISVNTTLIDLSTVWHTQNEYPYLSLKGSHMKQLYCAWYKIEIIF